KNGHAVPFDGDQVNRNKMTTNADEDVGLGEGWFIDHDAKKWAGKKASAYYNDSYTNDKYSADGTFQGGDVASAAGMWDQPGSINPMVVRMEFEVLALCLDDGGGLKQFLGSFSWGFDIDWTGPKKGAMNVTTSEKARETLSANYLGAWNKFRNFY